jgi:hypothetical protein
MNADARATNAENFFVCVHLRSVSSVATFSRPARRYQIGRREDAAAAGNVGTPIVEETGGDSKAGYVERASPALFLTVFR